MYFYLNYQTAVYNEKWQAKTFESLGHDAIPWQRATRPTMNAKHFMKHFSNSGCIESDSISRKCAPKFTIKIGRSDL